MVREDCASCGDKSWICNVESETGVNKPYLRSRFFMGLQIVTVRGNEQLRKRLEGE